MNYEVFSYGNVDALWGLFNALASIMAGSTFRSAIAIVVVVGFFASLLAFAFSPQRMAGPKWLVSVMLIYLVLFVPKATVHVVDKTGMGPPALIDNVPLGLAAQAGVVSSVGSTLTDLFEMALTVLPGPAGLPEEMTFTNNGLMFGARLIESSRRAVFVDSAFRADMANFFKNCTFYDISQGFISANDFATSRNIWELVRFTNPARFTQITDGATNAVDARTCPDAWMNLDLRMHPNVQALLQRIGLEANPFLQLSGSPTLSAGDAEALISTQLPIAYTRAKLGAAADSAAQLVMQNAVINSIGDGSKLMNQAQNDPTAMLMHLARAQATTQLNSQSIASSAMMSEALPLIRNGIEAVLYGIFPFILLLALTFGSLQAVQLLKSYALALAWIALWPPIYAIINYLGTLAWIKKVASAGYLPIDGESGMTLATATPIVDATMSSLSTMGNMVLAVPMIAGAIVFGLNRIAGMAMTMSQAVTSATGPIANQAAIGNIGLGNVRFQDQALAPNRSSPFLETFKDARGTSSFDIRDPNDTFRYQQTVGSSVVNLSNTSELSRRASEASAASHASGYQKTRAAEDATVGAFTSVLAWGDSQSRGTGGEKGTGYQDGVGRDHSLSKAMQLRDEFADRLGFTDRSGASSAFTAAVSMSTPKALKFVEASLALEGRQVSEEQITAAIDHAKTAARSQGIDRLDKLNESFVNSESFKNLSKTDKGLSERISGEVRRAKSYREGAAADFREAEEYRKTAEFVQSAAFSGKLDWTPEFHRWMREHHPDKMGVTGEAAWALAVQFVRESGIGVDRTGQPAIVSKEGGGNVTFYDGPPVGFESGAFADRAAAMRAAATRSVGGSALGAARFGIDVQNDVRTRGEAEQAATDAERGAAPTDGARLEAAHGENKDAAIEAYNRGIRENKATWNATDRQFINRGDDVSWAHDHAGPINNPALEAAEQRASELKERGRTDGGAITHPKQ